MRNVTARITDELYQALLTFCGENGTNVNQCLGKAVQGLLQGEVKMLPMGGSDVCPVCAHQIHLIQDNSKCYFWCHRCDWTAFIGKFTLPANIEDWTEKIKER